MRRPQKLKKNLPPVLTRQLFFLSSVKTSGRFFQICMTFSEKLDFIYNVEKNEEKVMYGPSKGFKSKKIMCKIRTNLKI